MFFGTYHYVGVTAAFKEVSLTPFILVKGITESYKSLKKVFL